MATNTNKKAAGAINTNGADFPTTAAQGKEFATLGARAALAGITLHSLDNDYEKTVCIASPWAMTRELADIGAIEIWLDRVTGGST